MTKVPFRHSKRWHATGYPLADGRRVIYQRDRRTFEALIVVEDDDGVGIGFRPNQVQPLIDALTKARDEAARCKLTGKGVTHMENQEGPVSETETPVETGSAAEGAAQTESQQDEAPKPQPDGD